ncbi:DUF2171 domain-containing protein [Deinococcus ficus]|nr:DUF2171 domain-containing protein [Deinococcus ficus]
MDNITPGLPIICTDNVVHGTAEFTEREYLVTAPLDDGRRHFIPLTLIDRVDDAVRLNVDHHQLLEIL